MQIMIKIGKKSKQFSADVSSWHEANKLVEKMHGNRKDVKLIKVKKEK